MYGQSRCLEKKNGVNRQRRNNSIDQILCLISQNTHRNIQNNRDVLCSCGTEIPEVNFAKKSKGIACCLVPNKVFY